MELEGKSNEIGNEKQCFFCEKNKGLKEKTNLVVMIGLCPCHERGSLKSCCQTGSVSLKGQGLVAEQVRFVFYRRKKVG